MHGPTFMGNALACSIANASIDVLLASEWEKNVSKIEQIFKQELSPLEELAIVKEVRCIGAIGVVELHDDTKGAVVQDSCVEQGVWIRPFGKLVYSIVSYTITEDELYKITEAIRKSITSL